MAAGWTSYEPESYHVAKLRILESGPMLQNYSYIDGLIATDHIDDVRGVSLICNQHLDQLNFASD
jgi:hypothetical protein